MLVDFHYSNTASTAGNALWGEEASLCGQCLSWKMSLHYSSRSNPMEENMFLEVFVNLIQWRPDLKLMVVFKCPKNLPQHKNNHAAKLMHNNQQYASYIDIDN